MAEHSVTHDNSVIVHYDIDPDGPLKKVTAMIMIARLVYLATSSGILDEMCDHATHNGVCLLL